MLEFFNDPPWWYFVLTGYVFCIGVPGIIALVIVLVVRQLSRK